MTASLSGVWNAQEFTDAGALAASYRLYTYAPGTTTQKTAYTDAAASVAHTYTDDGAGGLYIALNARGELPAPLFLTSGGYDLTLKTPAGASVWTRRAVGAADAVSAFSTTLASASPGSGVDLVGGAVRYVDTLTALRALLKTGTPRALVKGYGAYWYDSTDTTTSDNGGTVIVATDGARWKLDYGWTFDARQFGGDVTGATDDATKINAAIAATPSKGTLDLALSRVSVTPGKPGFDANLAAFNALTWKQNITVRYRGPSQEDVIYSDQIAANGTPVGESIRACPYHPGQVINILTPASYGNVAQQTHKDGATQGSTTVTAGSFVFRKDGGGQWTVGIRDSVPATATFNATCTGTTMTTSTSTGVAIGQQVSSGSTANGFIQGTKITGGSGTTWTVTPAQEVSIAVGCISGVNNRRVYDLSEVGSTIKMYTRDLTTGYQAWGNERSTMSVPHEFGGQIDISTGTHVNSGLPNTDPYLRLNDGNTFVGGLKIDHANSRLALVIETSVSEGTATLTLPANAGFLYSSTYSGANGNASALSLGKNSSTGRSLNSTGTNNAAGADYAEYENNNGLTIAKGAIIGFKSDGTLTLTFSEMIRPGIKTTDPGYVGGDKWGAGLTGEALEAARALVDRVAYCGKVPVNVTGAAPGDYIIAVAAEDGSITGQAVTTPTFDQYRMAVGRVNRILGDGRAEVAVIVH